MEKINVPLERIFDTNPSTIYGITLAILLLFIGYLMRKNTGLEKSQKEFIEFERKRTKIKVDELSISTKVLIKSNEDLNHKLIQLIDSINSYLKITK
jgi:hypothetical protein